MLRRGTAVRPITILVAVASIVSASAAERGGMASIRSDDLREWLSYIASDPLQGRAIYTSGLGMAASYITGRLQSWGLRPAGDGGGYLQTVRVLGVKTTSRSSVTVQVAGQSRTFTDGQGIIFPKNAGGKRRVAVDRVEFLGYGLDAPLADHGDYRGRDVKGAAVVWLGPKGPEKLDGQAYRRSLAGRNRYATEQRAAAASVGPEMPAFGGGEGNAGGGAASAPPASGGGRGGAIPAADFTTAQRLDAPLPPNVSAKDELFEFLFSRAPVHYDELKRKAEAQQALPSFHLEGVTLVFNIDVDYDIVRTQLSQNIVATVEGSDPQLKNTYVAFGAHYDHVGYAEGEVVKGEGSPRRLGAPGRVKDGAIDDRVWNGADDDGSGTVALLGLARAYALGPRPKRSLLFVWHTGEERGLLGSRYFADYPTVPLDRVVAQLNIDMIGRNRDDKPTEENVVYMVGSDRISTELDRVGRAANDSLDKPMTLDYAFNDPNDLEQLYYRSDHYSYAAKGIPVIFYTTGLHPDYHANTDEVSRIDFAKLTRITRLVYATGERLGDLDHAPARDNQGARAGKTKKPSP